MGESASLAIRADDCETDCGFLGWRSNPRHQRSVAALDGVAHSVFALAGLMFALLRRVQGRGAILTVMLIYPAPYYNTITAPRFRHPIEPLMVLLTGYLLVVIADEFRNYFGQRKTGVTRTSVAGYAIGR